MTAHVLVVCDTTPSTLHLSAAPTGKSAPPACDETTRPYRRSGRATWHSRAMRPDRMIRSRTAWSRSYHDPSSSCGRRPGTTSDGHPGRERPAAGYLLSFVFVAIYWVNHHHLMQVVRQIDGRTLWANIGLLFCLSLTPSRPPGSGRRESRLDPSLPTRLCFSLARGVHRPDDLPARIARARLEARGGHRERPERQGVGRAVPGRAGVLLLRAVGFRGALRGRRRIWFVPDKRIERVIFDR